MINIATILITQLILVGNIQIRQLGIIGLGFKLNLLVFLLIASKPSSFFLFLLIVHQLFLLVSIGIRLFTFGKTDRQEAVHREIVTQNQDNQQQRNQNQNSHPASSSRDQPFGQHYTKSSRQKFLIRTENKHTQGKRQPGHSEQSGHRSTEKRKRSFGKSETNTVKKKQKSETHRENTHTAIHKNVGQMGTHRSRHIARHRA